ASIVRKVWRENLEVHRRGLGGRRSGVGEEGSPQCRPAERLAWPALEGRRDSADVAGAADKVPATAYTPYDADTRAVPGPGLSRNHCRSTSSVPTRLKRRQY